MKCIVFGLGNFGLALSQRLTKRGNEVLGVDSDISKINLYKDSITNTVALDVKNEQALQTLPLTEVDVVFVVFGKDFGLSPVWDFLRTPFQLVYFYHLADIPE